MPATINGIIVVWALAICFATVNISKMEREKAKEVSLTSVISSFVKGGMTRLITCGRMIFRKVCYLE